MNCFARISAVCLALPLAAGCPSDDVSIPEDETANTAGTTTTGPSPATTTTAAATSTSTSTESATTTTAATTGSTGTTGSPPDLQSMWGSACTTDDECIARLGEGGVCLIEAVIYELPGGYCSKLCTLPEGSKYSIDDPQCNADGGIDCIGQAPLFEVCAPQCTAESQCSRDGYFCRNFPLIAEAGDPTYCLMPDCCQDSCDSC